MSDARPDQGDGLRTWRRHRDKQRQGSSGLPHGRPVAEASAEHPMHRPRPGWAENDPEDWLRGVTSTVRQLVERDEVRSSAVQGLALVSQRDPWVILDAAMKPLRESISWTDRRSEQDLFDFYECFDRKWLIDRTGRLPIPGLGLPVLLWVKRCEAELWRRARRLLSPKDYVLWRLTGELGTDVSMPARSVMNDLRSESWSSETATRPESLARSVARHPLVSMERIAELPAKVGRTPRPLTRYPDRGRRRG